LPDDGVGHRFSAGAVPQYGGFALVGHADRRDLRGRHVVFAHDLLRHRDLRAPDVVGIVFDPARLRKNLAKFLLRARVRMAVMVEQDGARAGGALVEGEYVLGHIE
jgi:hypothetical protein